MCTHRSAAPDATRSCSGPGRRWTVLPALLGLAGLTGHAGFAGFAGFGAIAAVTAVAPEAMAQSSSRSVMVRQDDSGVAQVQTYAIPNRSELMTPDLRPADLPQIIARLDLSEAQASVVSDRLRQYADALAALPLEVPEDGRGLLEEDDQGPQADSDPMSDAVRDAMIESGFDPERLSQDLQTGISIGIGMEQSDDGSPPEPRVNVNVSIGPAEGHSLPKEELERLRQVAEKAAKKIEEIARAQAMEDALADAEGQRDGGGPPVDRWNLIADRAQTMRDSVRAYRAARARERQQLDADLQSLLAPSQLERWPSFDRWVLRHHALPFGRLAGEQVDIFGVLDDLAERRPEAGEAMAAIRPELEGRLHALLSRRFDQALDASMGIDEASLVGDGAEVRKLALRLRDLHQNVRDANLGAIDVIGAVLADLPVEPDPFVERENLDASAAEPSAAQAMWAAATAGTPATNLGEHVRRSLRRQAFPMVWAVTPAQRAFAAIADLPLTEEQLSIAMGVAREYGIEHQIASQRLEGIVVRNDATSITDGFDGILEELGAERITPLEPRSGDLRPDGPVIRLQRDGPIAEALQRRLALDKRAMQRVYGMFDASVRAGLPGLPEVEDLVPATATSGDGARDPGFDDT